MKKKKEKYHVQIPVRFLFGPNPLFKYNYTKWVYTYIKLRYNYYIEHKPSSYFKLNNKEICALFEINRSTVFECLKELVKYELLSKGGRGEYKFNNEKRLVDTLIKGYEECFDGKTPFFQIYFNKFCELWNCGVNAKEVELYYYLVSEIEYDMKNEQWPEVKTNQTKACKVLHIDHRRYKKCVNKLLGLEYLYKNGDGKLFTLNPKPEELLKNDKPATAQMEEDFNDQMEKDAVVQTEENIDVQLEGKSNHQTEEEIYTQCGEDINEKMKIDSGFGIEAKKRRLLEVVKYDVLDWKITDSEKGKHIFPIVDHPERRVPYYDYDNAIPIGKCADYGIDIKKYEVN